MLTKLRVIENPFDLSRRFTRQLQVAPGARQLGRYIPQEYRAGYKVALTSRGEIPPDQWETTLLEPGDEIVVTPQVQADPVTWAAIGAWMAAHWAAITMVALSIASTVYSMLSAKKAAFASGGNEMDASPTYGWDGVQTTAASDATVAVIYGQVLVGGNFINAYVVNGDDNNSRLYALIGLGEGPLTAIAGIEDDTDQADLEAIGESLLLEGNSAANYDGVRVAVRMGSNDQAPIAGFNQLHLMNSYSDELAQEDAYILDTTIGRPVDAVRLNFRMDALYQTDSSGSMDEEDVRVEITWKAKDSADDYAHLKTFKVEGKYFSAVRRSFLVEFPARAEYKLRLVKVSGDTNQRHQRTCTITGMDEIVDKELAYPNTAMLGVEIVANDQLSGQLSNVEIIIKGLPVDYWDDAAGEFVHGWSRNPIWCMVDAATHEHYGAGRFIQAQYMNLEQARVEAAYCDALIDRGDGVLEPRFQLDGVIDTPMPAYDALNAMGAACNAIMYWSATMVQPVIDRPGVAAMPFCHGNIVADSLEIQYKSLRQTKNVVEVQYQNPDLNYARDIVRAVDGEALAAGDPERIKTVHLAFVARTWQAAAIAAYMVNAEKYVGKSIAFEAGIEAVFLTPGEIIEHSNQLTMWGVASGRLSGAGNDAQGGWVTLNHELVIPEGTTYRIKIRARAAVEQGIELQIAGAAGTYAAGEVIRLTGAFETVPQAFDVFAVGEATKIVKPFRLVSVSRGVRGPVKIQATEYDERVYSLDEVVIETPVYTALPDPRRIPRGVTHVTARNVTDGEHTIVVAWANSPDDGETPGALVDHYEVWSSTGGADYVLDGLSQGDQYTRRNVRPGLTYGFKVIAVSRLGRKSSLTQAIAVEIVSLSDTPPSNVTGLELYGLGNATLFTGRDAKFVWNESSLSSSTDVLGDATGLGAGAGTSDQYFQDYLVEIWSDGQLTRREAVLTNQYLYTHEKNAEDHGGAAARAFTLKVWARDIFNQTSAQAAQLSVSNPRPAAPGGVNATASYATFFVQWDPVADLDFAGYQVRKGAGADFAWDQGEVVYEGPSTQCSLARAQGDPIVSTYFFRVGCFDLFGSEDMHYSAPVAATSASVPAADVEKVALELSQMFTNLPVPDAPNWASNSPAAGRVSWLAHTLYYKGNAYDIPAGDTSFHYIYWSLSSPGVYQSADAAPEQTGDEGFILATNTAGAVSVAIGVIANQLIGSALIRDAAITNAKIGALAVEEANIAAAAVTTAKIQDLAVTSAKIESLEATKVVVAGGASLADWRGGEDLTQINGGAIAANTVGANALEVGLRGVTLTGITFYQDETTADLLRWSAGAVGYVSDQGLAVSVPTNAGNAVWSGGVLYVYWPKGANDLATTSDITVAYASSNVPLAAYRGGDLIDARLGRTQIVGDLIRTGTIDAAKLTVQELSAIAANLGTVNASSLTGVTITLAVPETSSRLRIDSAGIYVSHDEGATWRKFLAADADGDLVLSFDAFDEDSEIQGVATTAAPQETAYADFTLTLASAGWSEWLAAAWTTRDESHEVILCDLRGATLTNGLTGATTQLRIEDAEGTPVWTSAQLSFADLVSDPYPYGDTEQALTFKLPLPVHTCIAQGGDYRVAVRAKLTQDQGLQARLHCVLTQTAPAADTLAALSVTRTAAQAGQWSEWSRTLATGVALKRERAFVSASVSGANTLRTATAAQLGLFDAAGELLASRTFTFGTPASQVAVAGGLTVEDAHAVVVLGSLGLHAWLALGDQYSLGVRVQADAAAEFSVELKKSAATASGSLVKE